MAQSSSTPAVKEVDAYRELPASIRSTHLLFTSSNPSLPTQTLSSLPSLLLPPTTPHSSLPPAQTYALKIAQKSLTLSNPQKLSAASQKKALALARAKAEAGRGKGGVGLMGRKEGKRRAVWVPRKGEVTWERLEGLRELWEGYMVELLGLGTGGFGAKEVGGRWEGNAEGLQTKVAKADFTGCVIKVIDAKNRDLIGTAGTVIHETEQTFKIVTRASKIKVIPKQSTTFTISLPIPLSPPTPQPPSGSASSSRASTPGVAPPPQTPPPIADPAGSSTKRKRIEFDVYGSQLLFRNSDRAGRKFKSHGGIEIEGALG